MALPIIAMIFAAITTAVVVYVALYKYDDIISWLRSRSRIKQKDAENIAFSIKENIRNGNVKVVHGIFNTRTEELVEHKVVEAEKIDSELDRHKNGELVIYN